MPDREELDINTPGGKKLILPSNTKGDLSSIMGEGLNEQKSQAEWAAGYEEED